MSERNRVRRQIPYDWRRISTQEQAGGEQVPVRRVRRPRKNTNNPDPGAMMTTIATAWSRVGSVGSMVARRVRPGRPDAARQERRPSRRSGKRMARPIWSLKVMALGVLLFFLMLLVARTIAPSSTYTVKSETLQPYLEQPIVAWYAPDGALFGVVAAQTTYQPLARYGESWVQVEFPEHGSLWVETATFPTVPLDLLPDLRPPVDGYRAYTVAPDDTLRLIAGLGGSDAGLIRQYNRLEGDPQPERPLIVPHLSGMRDLLPPNPLLVKQGRTDQPAVALTIDLETGDAPVVQMLEVLRAHDARITIFVLGTWVEQHPDLARQIIAEGHELANHSLSHADFVTLTDEQIAQELAETERLVQEITGSTTRPYFRPPYGSYDDRVLRAVTEQGYLTIYWSIDSGDAVGAEKTLLYVQEQITGAENPEDLYGAIILAHCCNRTTMVEALPDVLKRFAELGIAVRPLTEVLGS
ncbi:MAG: polysaccharide deacetylase family protein [Chloroflexaceae bacterium]